ncbi:eukaryotic aspartyl protease family protein [Striga asiatica]|uniref:Eukaryotic aspartyl protease family protein n=1 Tax=Striga asiatica TaxID=4170 RepID=A0A5A7Q7P4_STRAF|nr:eukaryotic aspartyl protease family protein [Striga asiatica]
MCDRPCPLFDYEYGDGIVAGTLARDTLVVLSNDSNNNPNISFGCVQTSYREPIGIVGFGKGDQAISSKEYMQITPMQHNPLNPNFYYISLENITVENTTTIHAPETLRRFNSSSLTGGMIIDSGTRSTHLPDPFYSDLRKAIDSVVKYPREPVAKATTGFDLCYRIPVAPPTNGTRPVCLLFERMDDDPEASGVFGSSQQEGVEVVYDLENKRIGFHVTDCVSYGK